MSRLLELLFGQVTFCGQGGLYERFLSECAAQGLPVHGVRPVPGGFTARVAARRYRRLHPLARHCRVRLQVIKRRGLCFGLRRWRGRWGLVLGPAVFCAALVCLQQLIWSVQFVRTPPARQAALRTALYEAGLCEGVRATPERIEAARCQLALHGPELGWLSLNFIKGRLVVESTQAPPPPSISTGSAEPLIARADGKVLRLAVEEGWCTKRPGQTVTRGEVLIAPHKPDRAGESVPGRARGQVIGLIQRTYECRQPRQYTALLPAGPVRTGRALLAAGHRFPLGPPPPEEGRLHRYPLTLFGFRLPATVEQVTVAPRRPETVRLSREAARQFAAYACRCALFAEFPDARVLARSTEEIWQENACILRMTVQFEADLAGPGDQNP